MKIDFWAAIIFNVIPNDILLSLILRDNRENDKNIYTINKKINKICD